MRSLSTDHQISGGLSTEIEDRWIDGLMDELKDWGPRPHSLPHLVEDLNFYVRFKPDSLYLGGLK